MESLAERPKNFECQEKEIVEGPDLSLASERSSIQPSNEKQDLSRNDDVEISRTISRKSGSSFKDPGPPPDGGLVAWTQVAMGFLFIINSWGYIAAFGVFQTYYTATLGHPPSDISWIGAVQIFLLFFIGTFSGRALDAGLFRLVFGVGAFLATFGTFMTSIATEYYQIFLAQGVCAGIGYGLAFCPCMALVSTYFSKHKTFALTLAATGSAPGGMVFPALVSHLIPSIGFGWTVRVIGFIQLTLNVIIFAFMRTRIPPRKSGAFFEFAAFKEATYSLLCTGMFFNFWALYFAFFYIGSFAEKKIGLSLKASNNLLITLNGAGILGRVIPAWVADKYTGPLNIMAPFALISGVIVYGWYGVHSVAGLYVFAVIYGVFINGIQGMFPATISSLTTDLSKAGVRMGMAFTVVSFASLTGAPLGGALIQSANGSYLYAQMWAGSSLVLGGAFLFAARITRTGWHWKVKV